MRPSLALPSSLVLCACAACVTQSTDPTRALLDADRAFARATAERRIEGWVEAFDANGSQVDEEFRPITGSAAIRSRMSAFFADPSNHLEWEPDTAQLSEGGNLGSTSGRYRVSRSRADGSREVLSTGRYFDVWRKHADGTWKLLYDAGEPDATPPTR